MMTKQEAQHLAGKILSYSKLPGCRIEVSSSEDVFIRFANNGITTSGYRVNQSVSVSSATEDKRVGNATASSRPRRSPKSPGPTRNRCPRSLRRSISIW